MTVCEVCRTRSVKVNGDKSKLMVLNGEEGLEREVYIVGIHLGMCFKRFRCR